MYTITNSIFHFLYVFLPIILLCYIKKTKATKMGSQVCVDQNKLHFYGILVGCLLALFGYVFAKNVTKIERMSNVNLQANLSKQELLAKVGTLQDALHNSQLDGQRCQTDLANAKKALLNTDVRKKVRSTFYDPLTSPERLYPGGRLNGIPAYDDYQLVGFLYDNQDRYPLFGRPKYPGRSDKYEYYLIDESRNKLKIPFKTKNDNEIFDGDTTQIDILGKTLSAKIYEYDSPRYRDILVQYN
jgi:hypothetical protein